MAVQRHISEDGDMTNIRNNYSIRAELAIKPVVTATAKAYNVKQTTLYNHLNVWIRRCTTVDEANAIRYISASAVSY
jgi:hypothetical protein